MKFSGTYYYFLDPQGIQHDIYVMVGDDGSVDLSMVQEEALVLAIELRGVAGRMPPGSIITMKAGPVLTSPFMSDPALPWLVPKGFPPDPVPVVKAPPRVFQSKARTELPAGTPIVQEAGSPQYVRAATPGEIPLGMVTKCTPGLLDWYVEFTDDRPNPGPLKKS